MARAQITHYREYFGYPHHCLGRGERGQDIVIINRSFNYCSLTVFDR